MGTIVIVAVVVVFGLIGGYVVWRVWKKDEAKERSPNDTSTPQPTTGDNSLDWYLTLPKGARWISYDLSAPKGVNNFFLIVREDERTEADIPEWKRVLLTRRGAQREPYEPAVHNERLFRAARRDCSELIIRFQTACSDMQFAQELHDLLRNPQTVVGELRRRGLLTNQDFPLLSLAAEEDRARTRMALVRALTDSGVRHTEHGMLIEQLLNAIYEYLIHLLDTGASAPLRASRVSIQRPRPSEHQAPTIHDPTSRRPR